jgi:hypothetical protein
VNLKYEKIFLTHRQIRRAVTERQDEVKNDYIGKDKSVAEEVKSEVEKRKYLQGILKRLKIEYRQINTIVKD